MSRAASTTFEKVASGLIRGKLPRRRETAEAFQPPLSKDFLEGYFWAWVACPFVCSEVVVVNRVSRGKNGVTSNGILSRADVIETGAALIISTLSCHGSSLMRPPSGSAAI